ncbi:hypothetical protein [Arthrobacter sp. RAF14]|uniref:hypothetical protein n=1 Tax=Arthrobacter sp. RAF14 TaxID=3233051 RepID=UPI003F93EC84
MKISRFPQLLSRQATPSAVPEHEQAAQYFIQGATELVNGMEQLATALQATHPASARHLRFLAQQYAALAVTAVQTWPQGVPRD